MASIPIADRLRTLNLAYRKMQKDFRTFAPELFRFDLPLTTESDGHLLLPQDTYEVEYIVRGTREAKIIRINLERKLTDSGYYHNGIDLASKKRRIMIRQNGRPAANFAVTFHYLREYADLANESDTPVPFVGKAYLEMLTTLQAYMYFTEQGKERIAEKRERWDEYQIMLDDARRDYLDDEPQYSITTHSDAGDRRSSPRILPSTS